MKKIFSCLLTLIILGAIVFGVYYYFFLYNICGLPISYSIESVDPHFKITKNEVLDSAQDATNQWNNQEGKELFVTKDNGTIKINLIYDSRQENLDKTNSQISALDQSRKSIDNYQEEYNKLLSSYQNDLTDYNNEVSFWISQGGAPPQKFAELEAEKTSLEIRKNELISIAKSLNFQAENYNNNLSDFKNDLDRRKNIIVTQGEYDPNTKTINIYTFGNLDELRLVLMHELGHGLDLGHAHEKTSIMYELLDQQDLKNPTLTTEDLSMLENKCNLNKNLFKTLRTIRLPI